MGGNHHKKQLVINFTPLSFQVFRGCGGAVNDVGEFELWDGVAGYGGGGEHGVSGAMELGGGSGEGGNGWRGWSIGGDSWLIIIGGG